MGEFLHSVNGKPPEMVWLGINRVLLRARARLGLRLKLKARVEGGGILPNHTLIQRASHQGNCQRISATSHRDSQQRCTSNSAGTLAA